MTDTCPRRLRARSASLVLVVVMAALASSAAAQPAPTGADAAAQQVPTAAETALAAAAVEPDDAAAGPPATFTYANRPIVQFRAPFLGRPPAERAVAAKLALDRLVDAGTMGPVETRAVGTLIVVRVGGRDIFAIVSSDVDALAGGTLTETAALAVSRLRTALNEVRELRRPRQLLVAVLQVLLVTAALIAVIWLLRRARIAASRRWGDAAGRRLQASAIGDVEFVRSTRIIEFLQRIIRFLTWALGLVFAYAWLTFSLRRFPYTRPWGESLRGFLLDRLSLAGVATLHAIPGLFTVLLIVVLTRFASRTAQLLFQAVEDGRIVVPLVHPETARPTRKLLTVALWLFAVVVAYPYLPGSQSDVFKGVSVFVGLVVSLGSSGLVNQVMSGFTLTYSRALRVGDFVAVGGVEGTVTQLGTLASKIRTGRGEDVTIPNAVVASQTVTNYSRLAETDGVFVPTSVTIGYDVPWRQVQALLLLAAARTPGVRREPAPVVRQTALEDAVVNYTLLFCPERPAQRGKTLAAVHANILDAFNEYGVQLMSPRYEADPEAPKVVPRDRWFQPPAIPDPPATSSADSASGSPGPPRG